MSDHDGNDDMDHDNSTYLTNIITIPWFHLKFLDESHFDQRDLYQRKGYAQSNRRIEGIKPATPGVKSCSITIMTTLDNAGGFVIGNIRVGQKGSNTANYFAEFIMDQIEVGNLVSGDYLILDNAAIHIKGAVLLHPLLVHHNINIRFLPTYSPELNPCEMIFSQIKRYIRDHRRPVTIQDELIPACANVHRNNVIRYYYHCIDRILLQGN